MKETLAAIDKSPDFIIQQFNPSTLTVIAIRQKFKEKNTHLHQ